MHVIAAGPPDAPAILLVHGFASSLHAFDALVAALPDRRIVRVDLLGHGRTGGGAADAATQAAAVAAVLAELDLHDVTAVGHSFGADVVIALGHDPRVARVVVLAQGPDYADTRIPQLRALTSRPALVRRLHRTLRPVAGVLARLLSRWPVIARGLSDARAVDPAMLQVVLTDRRATLAARPLDAQLVGIPATVVLGGRDRLYGTRSAARYRAAGADVVVIAGSGHAMPQQHPAAIAAVLRGLTAR